jgi:hypothetical protein
MPKIFTIIVLILISTIISFTQQKSKQPHLGFPDAAVVIAASH